MVRLFIAWYTNTATVCKNSAYTELCHIIERMDNSPGSEWSLTLKPYGFYFLEDIQFAISGKQVLICSAFWLFLLTTLTNNTWSFWWNIKKKKTSNCKIWIGKNTNFEMENFNYGMLSST